MRTLIALMLMTGSAFAQSTGPTNPNNSDQYPAVLSLAGIGATTVAAMMPTVAECSGGWKVGMIWTLDEFTKACGALKR